MPVEALTSTFASTSVLTLALIWLATSAYSIWLVKSPNEMKPTRVAQRRSGDDRPGRDVTVTGLPPAPPGTSTVTGPVGADGVDLRDRSGALDQVRVRAAGAGLVAVLLAGRLRVLVDRGGQAS